MTFTDGKQNQTIAVSNCRIVHGWRKVEGVGVGRGIAFPEEAAWQGLGWKKRDVDDVST